MHALTALLFAALAAVSSAQRVPVPPQSPPPPQSEPRQGEPRQSERPLRDRAGAEHGDAPRALDADTEAWARSLVSRLGDPNRAIARSAAAGLIALGPPVVPMLRRVADSDDPQMARLAHHALEEIRLGPPHMRRPGGPDGPDAPGRGPRGDGPRGEGPRGERPRSGPDGGPPLPPPPRDGARRDAEPRSERREIAPPREAPLPRERARRGPDAPRPPRHDDRKAI